MKGGGTLNVAGSAALGNVLLTGGTVLNSTVGFVTREGTFDGPLTRWKRSGDLSIGVEALNAGAMKLLNRARVSSANTSTFVVTNQNGPGGSGSTLVIDGNGSVLSTGTLSIQTDLFSAGSVTVKNGGLLDGVVLNGNGASFNSTVASAGHLQGGILAVPELHSATGSIDFQTRHPTPQQLRAR